MSEIRVSILLPVKNGAPFLRECLFSILAQSMEEWELWAIDDHSADDTLEILREFQHLDDRVHVLSNEGKGIARALQTGSAQARGKFITRMDADDVMHPDKLEQLMKTVSAKSNGIAVSLVSYFSETALGDGYQKYERWLNQLTMTGSNYTDIYKECVIPSPAWMMSHDMIQSLSLLDNLNDPEDYDFCFRLYQHGIPVIAVPSKLHLWRDHAGRTSRTDRTYDIRSFGLFKLRWWLKLDHNPDNELILWGAGKKGKELARELLNSGIEFRWITDNRKKQATEIYGVRLFSSDQTEFTSHQQYLIAVSSPEGQREISTRLKQHNLMKGRDFFLFY